ncbi:MAG: GIY-YIG nuclease family protein [Lachnospiraceae bacterium]|nr:GIY-YIG nuclease family protein [Lachnospiraceae bacterium]MBR3237355.1 GIY-YIG nuclease family protein [Oscillospiraceae bacterium]
MISGIYCIENKENGRAYIGQSVDIKKRWAQHRCDLRAGRHDNEHLQRAWEKYGEECFSFSIVEEVEPEMLNLAEEMWIQIFDAYDHGYNMTLGGEATRGHTPWNKGKRRSERVRKILSESAKKRTGEKNAFYGKKHSTATRAKISAYRSDPVMDPETGTLYPSAKYADLVYGGRSSNVSKVLNGACESAYGVKWERLKGEH